MSDDRTEERARTRADLLGYGVTRYAGTPPTDAALFLFALRHRQTGSLSPTYDLETLHRRLDVLEQEALP